MSDTTQTITSAYKELQDLVAAFEQDEVNLDTSIPKFKRGLELATYLKNQLSVLKNEVKEIKDKFKSTESVKSSMVLPGDDSTISAELPF